jgi:hypothetical protein
MPKATTAAEMIQLTAEIVRGFYSRDKEIATAHLADNFMWIGGNDFQWCEGLAEFHRVTDSEFSDELPAMISDEEYHVLFHDNSTWMLYGRYKAAVALADGTVLLAHVRGTYVWRHTKGGFKLAHIHGSHAQDIPLIQSVPPQPVAGHGSLLEYMRHMDDLKTSSDKILFRETTAMHRYLFPEEIICLKASGPNTEIITKQGSILASGTLIIHEPKMPPQFMRIHKSYIVNLRCIDTFCRYKAILSTGQTIPIGKERYMELKRGVRAQASV